METKTVSELAELFGVTRQAMNKRVKSLDEKFVAKNERNVTVVNVPGILELERLYGKVVTAEAEVMEGQKAETTEVALQNQADDATSKAYEMITALMKDKNAEIDRLNQQLQTKDDQLAVKDEQLSAKDQQLAAKDAQIKQQQDLMNQAWADQKAFLDDLQKSMQQNQAAQAENTAVTAENEVSKGFFARLFKK